MADAYETMRQTGAGSNRQGGEDESAKIHIEKLAKNSDQAIDRASRDREEQDRQSRLRDRYGR
jgi:hypothetical protein